MGTATRSTSSSRSAPHSPEFHDEPKNSGSSSVSRFRQVAMGSVSGPANGDELRSLVAKLNDEVRAFERRRNFLVKWQADTVAMSLVTKLATDALDAKFCSMDLVVCVGGRRLSL